MDLDTLLASIPYLQPHRLKVNVENDASVTAILPFAREMTNHVGTLHAAAIYAVAETAAGVAAGQIVSGERAIVLLRGATIRYTRRADADLTAKACVVAGQSNSAAEDFDRSARADARVEVSILDPEGTKVFEGEFDYALRPRKS